MPKLFFFFYIILIFYFTTFPKFYYIANDKLLINFLLGIKVIMIKYRILKM